MNYDLRAASIAQKLGVQLGASGTNGADSRENQLNSSLSVIRRLAQEKNIPSHLVEEAITSVLNQ